MTTETTTEPTKPFIYKTASRGLAAALMALGFELFDVERLDHEVLFSFPLSRMLLDATDSFMVETLSVSASRMALAFEQLDDVVLGHGALGEVDINDL